MKEIDYCGVCYRRLHQLGNGSFLSFDHRKAQLKPGRLANETFFNPTQTTHLRLGFASL
jgi:hypothetical protein